MKKQEYKKAFSNGTTVKGCGYRYTFVPSGDGFVALPDPKNTPSGGFAAYLDKDEAGFVIATEETTGRLINPEGFCEMTYKRAADAIAERYATAVIRILESGKFKKIIK